MTELGSSSAPYAPFPRRGGLCPVLEPADDLAHSDLTDEEALEQLRPTVQANLELARTMLPRANDGGRDYIRDRMRRLVVAAVEGTPVAPMPAEYAAEMELGRLPIAEAFRQLEALVPALAALRIEAEAWRDAHPDSEPVRDWVRESGKLVKRARAVVGPESRNPDSLCRSPTADGVAVGYLLMLLRDTQRGDPSTPYFQFQYARTPATGHIRFGRIQPCD